MTVPLRAALYLRVSPLLSAEARYPRTWPARSSNSRCRPMR
jgi:hypothetical protein